MKPRKPRSPLRSLAATTAAILLTPFSGFAQDPEPVPLEASFASASSALSAGQVFFDASASGGDGSYTFAWDFGDGGMSAVEDTLHTFASDATFTVILTVTDGLGEVTTATADIEIAAAASDFTMQVLHSSDNESSFQNPNTLEEKIINYGALVEGLRALGTGESIPTLYLTAGDHTLPGPFYQASAEVPTYGAPGIADILFYNAMGLTANGMGNHEFDGGIDEFATMLASAQYPFLAVNLDFANVTLQGGTPPIEVGVDGASVLTNAGKVAKSSWVEVEGEKIGLIGRAPADFFNVVADPDTTLPGLDFVGGRDATTNQPLVSALTQVLEQVDILKAQGINKIILMDHAQDFTGDPLSAQDLRDIDVIVSAGSTGFLARESPIGPFNLLRDGDESSAGYPTLLTDMDRNPVIVVNSEQQYRYLGNLIIGFDTAGLLNFIDVRSGPIAATQEAVDALGAEVGIVPLMPSAEVADIWSTLQNTPLIQSQFEIIGTTGKALNGLRADVRSRETNLGRVVADSTIWGAQRFLDDSIINWDVDIALKNGGGIRDTILGPNITRLTIGAALAFDNRLAIVEIKAGELLAAIENAVSRFPARDGRFPQVAGLTIEYDRERPGIGGMTELFNPSRVATLIVHRANGTDEVLVENFRFVGSPSSTFVLATNNFLLTGGDGYAALAAISDDAGRQKYETTIGEQQILAEYIVGPLGGNVDVSDPPPFPRVSFFTAGKSYATTAAGTFDGSSAEVVDYCPIAKRLFVSNAADDSVDVFDATKSPMLRLIHKITELGGSPNSVAVNNGILAVAVENSDDKTLPGWVVCFDTLFGRELSRVQVGSLPDMLIFSPDGTKIVVANEGEPSEDNTVDPAGSISIIDMGDGYIADADDLTQAAVTHVGFELLDVFTWLRPVLAASGIRLFGEIYDDEGNFVRMTTVSEDLEPEFVAINPAGTKAFVTLQENNAIAVVDIASGTLDNIFPLGWKDHSLEGNGFDASDRDGMVDIRPHPVRGLYLPDAITAFDSFGKTYLVTANEGDSRDWDNFSEEVRVADLKLDPTAFPNAAELQASSGIGRLKTTTTLGDTDGDGDFDEIYTYGSRSFTIWDTEGKIVFDSGDQFEQILSERFPEVFNASNDNAKFDNRSDDKGPEPEGVEIGQVGDRTYAFIGLERIGGFMIYDITFPQEPIFVDYINDRNFSVDPEDDFPAGGNLGPEGLHFIPASQSPNGKPTLAVSFEVSGTTALYEIAEPSAGKFSLQVLHSSDNESFFQDPNTGEEKILGYGAAIESLRKLGAREQLHTLYLTAGDHTLPNSFYRASAQVTEFGKPGLADIAFYNAMGLTANGMGNHEFDGGINDFAEMLATANYPFIAANLDFSKVELADGTTPINIGIDGASVQENAGKICGSSYVEVGGEKIGLIGRAPADFFNVVADPETTLPGLDFFGGRDEMTNQPLVSAVTQVLAQVDILKAKGINKIILMDHAQDFTTDPLSANALRDIDIIVTAGSTGFMANATAAGPFNLLRDGDIAETAYPTERTDMNGDTVLVVNSDQLYSYVGQLIVSFDPFGKIESYDNRSGPVSSGAATAGLFAAELGLDEPCPPNARTVEIWNALKGTPLITNLFEIVGTTTTPLNGSRADVRSRETNLGVLAADSTLWYAQEFAAAKERPFKIDVALKNGGGIRADIVGPNITRLAIGTALAFDNRLALLEVTAAELVATMENAVSRFPATDGRFPHVAGMHLMFDPTKPGMSDQTSLMTPSRIESLIVTRADGSQDLVVENFILRGDVTRTFGLATNNFLATGGDGYAALGAVSDDPAREICETTVGEQQILAEYLVGQLGGEVDIPDPTTTPRVDACISKALGGYLGWAKQFFTNGAAGTGIAQDFNNDGTSNLVAYAFQMDPTGAAVSRNLPTASVDGDDLILTLKIVNDSAIGVIIESSINLSDWSEMIIDSDYTIDADVENTGNGTRSLTLRIPGVIATQETIFTRAKIVTND